MIRHGLVILVLTALTQVGGRASLLALLLRPLVKRLLLPFLGFYVALSAAAYAAAPLNDRVALRCFDAGADKITMPSPFYCALNRHGNQVPRLPRRAA